MDDWLPTPFRQFILKLHGLCNLACRYCYVYEMADQSWKERPAVMSPAIIQRTAGRIAEHASSHDLGQVEIIFHGGEPLMGGVGPIRQAVQFLRQAMPHVDLSLRMQTNGVLLSDKTLEVLDELGVQVGVSVDGGSRTHDRYRIRHDGQGSHRQVSAGVERLAREPYRRIFSGLLCTIDVTAPPVEIYEALLAFSPPMVDFLLPHGNWSAPPPGWESDDPRYGRWLSAVFDRWYDAPRRETQVRFFEEIINGLLGGQSTSEAIGFSPVALIVVDTDGTLQQVDTLKSAHAGGSETGMNVLDDPFDSVLMHPAIIVRQIGLAALGSTCGACSIKRICGGGYFPHRYRAAHGFTNPSVYCADLRHLIGHIGNRLHHDLSLRLEESR